MDQGDIQEAGGATNPVTQRTGIRAVFIGGKRFRQYGVIVAMRVAADRSKFVLGIYQASNENHESCLELLKHLERWGLPSAGLFFIVDGGSGLNKALNIKYACDDKQKPRAIRIRYYAHKWRNIEAALGDLSDKASVFFWALRDAKNMSEAKVISDRLEAVLGDLNVSALQSYLEAKDDLLAIHELKLLLPELGEEDEALSRLSSVAGLMGGAKISHQ